MYKNVKQNQRIDILNLGKVGMKLYNTELFTNLQNSKGQ